MASTKEIKSRIKSIKNTKKITKAMELVAASKMKRAVSRTLDSRFYRTSAEEVLGRIAGSLSQMEGATKFIGAASTDLPTLAILVTSNRGLCGGYNAQVLKKALETMRAEENLKFIVVGRKGESALSRLGQDVLASFVELPDVVTLADTLSIASIAVDEFNQGHVGRIVMLYTDYVSALSQVPQAKQLVPIDTSEIKAAASSYDVEPADPSMMAALVEELVQARIYQMILESRASEESSRMIAMKNASEAAGEMIDDLTLSFNKARQASITQEISEISAGVASAS
jgi:F-type H+-transporting ATPase subunit gamma